LLSKDNHPSHEELLLAADGELPDRRAAQIRAHLAACWNCRAQMAEIESAIADFARSYREGMDSLLPPAAGQRAFVKAQLAGLAAKQNNEHGSWRRFFDFNSFARVAAAMGLALLVAALGGAAYFEYSASRGANSATDSLRVGVVPDRNLTPGATRRVSISDVCSMAHEEVTRDVSLPLRQEIFREYGIANPGANNYEIDYLIAPGLGGAEDIHNLWPESYYSPTWNARVKDSLEEQLHEMVCSGQLDLSTAQHDIATDWIAAYKKYFHTDRPLPRRSDPLRFVGASVPFLKLIAQ
jgi:hypothetical protein